MPSFLQWLSADLTGRVALGYAAYPNTLLIGGNTGTVNSFTGVSPGDLSDGVYNLDTLFEGDNFACFAFQLLENGLPDFLKPDVGKLSTTTNLINKALAPILGNLSCPALSTFDQGLFNQFPGYTYSPTGPATNY